jgi:hypothetical protein
VAALIVLRIAGSLITVEPVNGKRAHFGIFVDRELTETARDLAEAEEIIRDWKQDVAETAERKAGWIA